VASIVFMTVLSFRLYVSPTEIAEGMLAWLGETIPDEYANWLFIMSSIVVFGLGITVQVMTNGNYKLYSGKRGDNYYPTKDVSLPTEFNTNFDALFSIIITIIVLHASISIYGLRGRDIATKLYTDNTISLYTLLKTIFVALTLGITFLLNKETRKNGHFILTKSEIENYEREEKNGKDTGVAAEANSKLIVMSFAIVSWYLISLGINFDNNFTHSLFKGWDWVNRLTNGGDILAGIGIFIGLIVLDNVPKPSAHSLFNSLEPNQDTEYIYHKILISLLFVWMVCVAFFTYFGYNTRKSGMKGMKGLAESLSLSFPLNMVDAFSMIKGFLVCMAVIYGGLTINSWNKIPEDNLKYNPFHIKEIFLSFISFLMFILTMTLLNSNSIPRLTTLIVEVLSPIAMLIMVGYLVFYTNELSKLSNKNILAGIGSKDTKSRAYDPAYENKKVKSLVDKSPIINNKVYRGDPNIKV